MMSLRLLVAAGLCLAAWAGDSAAAPPAGAAPGARARFADVQVRSAPDMTELRVGLPPDVELEDRTKKRPGDVAVDEIRLFFPTVKVDRSRLITVDDPIV